MYEYNSDHYITTQYYLQFAEVMGHWGPNQKIEYDCDINGRLISKITFQRHRDSISWIRYTKFSYQYSVNNNISLETIYHWDSILGWVGYIKNEYLYNHNGLLIQSVKFNWSPSQNDWLPDLKNSIRRDDDGNTIETISFLWDFEIYEWIGLRKNTFSYDTVGNLLPEIKHTWNSDQWNPVNRDDMTYDSDGNRTLYMTSTWYSIQNYWEPYWKQESVFDETGQLSLSFDSYWTEEDSALRFFEKREYEFNNMGHLVYFALYEWGRSSQRWYRIRKLKNEYIYNSQGKEISKTLFHWSSSKLWFLWARHESCFDELGNNTITAYYRWDSDVNEWGKTEKAFQYYTLSSLGTENQVNSKIQIYPNPTSGLIYISGIYYPAEIKLYSIQGKLLKTVHQVKSSIDISDLPSGLYILNLTSGDQVLRERIVKK